MGLFGIVDSVAGTMDLVNKENVTNYLAVSVNYVKMAEFQQGWSSSCWIGCQWYGCNPSVCDVVQTVMCGRLRRAELCALVCGLRCITSMTFSSSSIFRRTWRFSTTVFTGKGAIFLQMLLIRSERAHVDRIFFFKNVLTDYLTGALALPLPTVHKMYFGLVFMRKRNTNNK